MTAETSLQNYFDPEHEKTRTTDRDKVFHVIRKNQPITGSSIARILEKPYHTVSGRITELKEKDRIQIAGHTKNRFGNPCNTYEVKK